MTESIERRCIPYEEQNSIMDWSHNYIDYYY